MLQSKFEKKWDESIFKPYFAREKKEIVRFYRSKSDLSMPHESVKSRK